MELAVTTSSRLITGSANYVCLRVFSDESDFSFAVVS